MDKIRYSDVCARTQNLGKTASLCLLIAGRLDFCNRRLLPFSPLSFHTFHLSPMRTPLLAALAAIAVISVPAFAWANSGDFSGAVAIGTSYAGSVTAPTNGLIVQGSVGLGTSSSTYPLQIIGAGTSTPNLYATDSSTGSLTFQNFTNVSGGLGSPLLTLSTGASGTSASGAYVALNGNAEAGVTLIATGNPSGQRAMRIGNEHSNGCTNCLAIQGLNDAQTSVTSTPFQLADSAPSNSIVIDSSGNVGLSNSSPAHILHVGSSSATGVVAELQNSSGACTHNPGASSETVTCSSDVSLKTNIHDAADALRQINDIRVRDFTVKSTGEHRTGVIAQELLRTHPNLVHTDKEGLYSVDEPNPWLLLKTIQELDQKVADQQIELITLKRTVSQLSRQGAK